MKSKEKDIVEEIVKGISYLSLDEIENKLGITCADDLLILKRTWFKYAHGLYNLIENDLIIADKLKLSKEFFASLVDDGILSDEEKVTSFFRVSMKNRIKVTQSREFLPRPEECERLNPIIICKKLNSVYRHAYETIIEFQLKAIAIEIAGITNPDWLKKARIVRILSDYKDGRFSDLFLSLIPQIRNSISHEDWIWDAGKGQIEFIDPKKPSLYLTLKEYYRLCFSVIKFSLIISYNIYKLKDHYVIAHIKKLDTVYNYLKGKNLELVRAKESKKSLLDLAHEIEKGLL